jgi:copper chaperone CopZ
MTCAFAVRGALKKIAGVESVEVSLNKGLAAVKLKPGNTVSAEQFWDAVKKNGFTPKETHVVVRGDVLSTGGKVQLKVTGTTRAYELIADAKSSKVLDEAKGLTGKTITVEGSLTPEKDIGASVPLRVVSMRP